MKLKDFYQQCWFSDVLNQNSTKRNLVEILKIFVNNENVDRFEVFPTEDSIFVYVEDDKKSNIKMPKHGELRFIDQTTAYNIVPSCTLDYAKKVVNLYLSNSKYYHAEFPSLGLNRMQTDHPELFGDSEPDQD